MEQLNVPIVHVCLSKCYDRNYAINIFQKDTKKIFVMLKCERAI